jgi:hypothetical protein
MAAAPACADRLKLVFAAGKISVFICRHYVGKIQTF